MYYFLIKIFFSCIIIFSAVGSNINGPGCSCIA